MLAFLTQPAVAPACYVPKEKDTASVLFDGADNVLSRMAALGNRRKFTVAGCIMRGKLGAYQAVFGTQTDNNNNVFIRFQDTDELQFALTQAGSQVGYRVTIAKYRDTAPLLFVASCDTTKGPGNSPMRLSVNGPSTPTTVLDPAINYDTHMHVAGTQYIGRHSWSATGFLDALVSNLIVVDGADLDWSTFFEQNIHGVWVWKAKADIYAAIAAAGGWGVNGCHLDFADPLDPGKDVSGQGNHWTADGFAPSGRDTVASTPTNVFASLNPLTLGYGTGSTITLSEGNLAVAFGGVNQSAVRASIDPSAAAKPVRIDATLTVLGVTTNTGLYVCGASYLANGALSNGATVATYGVNDTITGEYDPTSRVVRYYKNGVLQGTCAATGKTVAVAGGNSSWRINAGQRAWAYATPTVSGLCTDALREPDIKDPSEALAQATATGADIVSVLDALTAHWDDAWVEIIKRRDAAEDWRVRFADDPANAWATNNANAKGPAAALAPGGAYVGYRLRVGQRYGVWTAEVEHVNGTPTTVTHGLDTARNMVIATRVSTDGGDRYCHHPDMPVGVLGKLNTNVQPAADGTLTAIEASSFEIAAGAPSGTYRVLVLAHRPGWLEIGSYKGTGQAGNNGAFDPMGIAPMWQLVKRLDNSGAWMLSSTALAPVNPMIRHLDLDKSNPEYTTGYDLDMVVGGVKYRTAGHSSNDTNGTYLRVAIGRPVGGVCVAPATAR